MTAAGPFDIKEVNNTLLCALPLADDRPFSLLNAEKVSQGEWDGEKRDRGLGGEGGSTIIG